MANIEIILNESIKDIFREKKLIPDLNNPIENFFTLQDTAFMNNKALVKEEDLALFSYGRKNLKSILILPVCEYEVFALNIYIFDHKRSELTKQTQVIIENLDDFSDEKAQNIVEDNIYNLIRESTEVRVPTPEGDGQFWSYLRTKDSKFHYESVKRLGKRIKPKRPWGKNEPFTPDNVKKGLNKYLENYDITYLNRLVQNIKSKNPEKKRVSEKFQKNYPDLFEIAKTTVLFEHFLGEEPNIRTKKRFVDQYDTLKFKSFEDSIFIKKSKFSINDKVFNNTVQRLLRAFKFIINCDKLLQNKNDIPTKSEASAYVEVLRNPIVRRAFMDIEDLDSNETDIHKCNKVLGFAHSRLYKYSKYRYRLYRKRLGEGISFLESNQLDSAKIAFEESYRYSDFNSTFSILKVKEIEKLQRKILVEMQNVELDSREREVTDTIEVLDEVEIFDIEAGLHQIKREFHMAFDPLNAGSDFQGKKVEIYKEGYKVVLKVDVDKKTQNSWLVESGYSLGNYNSLNEDEVERRTIMALQNIINDKKLYNNIAKIKFTYKGTSDNTGFKSSRPLKIEEKYDKYNLQDSLVNINPTEKGEENLCKFECLRRAGNYCRVSGSRRKFDKNQSKNLALAYMRAFVRQNAVKKAIGEPSKLVEEHIKVEVGGRGPMYRSVIVIIEIS